MQMLDPFKIRGRIKAECIRGNYIAWREDVSNLVVNSGKNYILNSAFNGATASTSWFIGLINNSPSPTLLSTNTMSSGSRNWSELHSEYSESDRPAWGIATTSSQALTNSSTVNFTFTSGATVYGMFVCDDDTKNGTTGTMISAGAFSSPRAVINGDVLKITYTLAT